MYKDKTDIINTKTVSLNLNSLMDNGMEKMAPPPVPTHRRPEMAARDEIWRGDSDRKAGPKGDGHA